MWTLEPLNLFAVMSSLVPCQLAIPTQSCPAPVREDLGRRRLSEGEMLKYWNDSAANAAASEAEKKLLLRQTRRRLLEAISTCYQWDVVSAPPGDNSLLVDSHTLNATAFNLLPGLYTFQLTVTDNFGATATAMAHVSIPLPFPFPPPAPPLPPSPPPQDPSAGECYHL